MYLKQFYIDGLAHASYLLGSEGMAAVVDPRRDVDIYLREARKQGLRITHVIETHLHADFISGHLELARQTGAQVYVSRSAGAQYEHIAVSEGDEIRMGKLVLRILETPGHTPEHITPVVSDLTRAEDPCLAFTGDVLFVGGVGRPDLFGTERAKQLSDRLFDSLHNKLGLLPDYVEVYPAHGEGSLCGRNLSEKRWSTIGYEKRFNDAFQPATPEKFRKEILKDMPMVPRYFHRTSEINRLGPKILGQICPPRAITVGETNELLDKGHLLLDIRTPEAFGGAHIPGAYNLWFSHSLATWAGWVLPNDRPILLLLDAPEHGEEVVRQLLRVGFDDVAGYVDGGMEDWMEAGLPIATLPQISIHQLRDSIESDNETIITDVRTLAEYNEGHIAGALNIHAGQMDDRYDELNKDDAIAIICRTAHRSSVAGSILKRHGFENVCNVSGGMTAWRNVGYEVAT